MCFCTNCLKCVNIEYMNVNMDIVVQTQKKYKQKQTTTKDPQLDAILGLDKGPQSTCLLMLPEPITMSGTTHTMD